MNNGVTSKILIQLS